MTSRRRGRNRASASINVVEVQYFNSLLRAYPPLSQARFLGVFAVAAGGSGPRRGHVICSGVFAVAAVIAVAGFSWYGPSFGLLDGLG